MRILRVRQKLIVILLTHTASFVQIRYYNSRVHYVDPNSLRSELESSTPGQLISPCFRYAISKDIRKRPLTSHTRDVYDVSLRRFEMRVEPCTMVGCRRSTVRSPARLP